MGIDFGRLSILLVEDHDATAETLLEVLRAAGVGRVRRAADVEEAIRAFREVRFDLMVCDFKLGAINGLALVKVIRRDDRLTNRYLPIVMTTGDAAMHRYAAARDAGVNDFLSKPIHPPTLIHTIRTVLDHPRAYVDNGSYFGPDRRLRQQSGMRGRRGEDREKTLKEPADPWD